MLSGDTYTKEFGDLITSDALSYHEEMCIRTGTSVRAVMDITEGAVQVSVSPPGDAIQSLENGAIDADKPQRLTKADMEKRQQRYHSLDSNVLEAFQRYRNFVLDADYYVTYRALDAGRCLDECLRDKDM